MSKYTNDELPALGALLNRVEREIQSVTYIRDVLLGDPPTMRMSPDDVERRRLEGERMHREHAARTELAASIQAHRDGRVHIHSETVRAHDAVHKGRWWGESP